MKWAPPLANFPKIINKIALTSLRFCPKSMTLFRDFSRNMIYPTPPGFSNVWIYDHMIAIRKCLTLIKSFIDSYGDLDSLSQFDHIKHLSLHLPLVKLTLELKRSGNFYKAKDKICFTCILFMKHYHLSCNVIWFTWSSVIWAS
jgi:hypothetical protein